MKHIELSQSYLSCVQNFINQFTNLEDNFVRINMVKNMEQHVLDLNHIAENILEDNQPIRFLMQHHYIKERIDKINKRLFYLDLSYEETIMMYNEWCDFVEKQIEILSKV
jgi:hypothetical protein